VEGIAWFTVMIGHSARSAVERKPSSRALDGSRVLAFGLSEYGWTGEYVRSPDIPRGFLDKRVRATVRAA
jgi:hypothetical protein